MSLPSNSFSTGITDLPPGMLASVVTSLEMFSRPAPRDLASDPRWKLVPVTAPTVEWYRNLYRRIGEPWLWFSRLEMSKEKLAGILSDPKVSITAFHFDGKEAGFLELDFRVDGECELAFLGVTSDLTGKGIGKWILEQAMDFAWQKGIRRFWVHTCSLDGPGALALYRSVGFIPFKRQIEVVEDPRHTGVLSPTAAPQIPLL